MADPGSVGDIGDLSNQAAYLALDDLLKKGHLSQAQADLYKSKFAKLHEVVLQTFENEKNLLKNAKALNQEAAAEQVKLKKTVARSSDNRETIHTLRTDQSKGESEVAICEEKAAMMSLEIAELNRQTEEALKEKKLKEQELADKMQPKIQAAQHEVETLRREVDKDNQYIGTLTQQQQNLHDQIAAMETRLKELEHEKEESRKQTLRVKNEPIKARKQCDLVDIALKGLLNEYETVEKILDTLNMELSKQEVKRKAIDDDKEHLMTEFHNKQGELDRKEAICSEIEGKKNTEKDQELRYRQTRMELEQENDAAIAEYKRAVEQLHRAQRTREEATRSYRLTEHQFSIVQGALPLLTSQLQEAARRHDHAKQVMKEKEAQKAELTRDLDIFIHNFLNAEGVEKEKEAAKRAIDAENGTCEAELKECMLTEVELSNQLAQLASKRDTKARELAKCLQNVKEAHDEMQLKQLVLLDLTKQNSDISVRLKEFSSLYEVVKNERNKYVNLIQSSSQALAEMKEKIGIVDNETEILRNENLAKEKALAKEKVDHEKYVTQRDQLRIESNKNLDVYREKQEQVDQQIAEIDKLNSIINGIEREMLRLKRQYEMAVEQRNYTGIQLIDRNDELCILYEKSNIQDDVLRNGHIEFRERTKELRWLRLIHADLLREIALTRKIVPRLDEYRREIREITEQLHAERLKADQLSYDLETPANKARWRALDGKDLEPDELATKVRELEERLNDKKEQMLEKELVLEEVSSLADRLRKQAADGREDTLELANKVNEFQSRIRSITRKMMATVSELSMYQATAIKLNTERQYLSEEISEAKTRTDAGEAPTDEAESEWQRMERDRLTRLEYHRSRAAVTDESQDGVQSTADARPNAYLPEDLGIPKPYGGMPPFKPSELGSTMRHIVKPQPREIQI